VLWCCALAAQPGETRPSNLEPPPPKRPQVQTTNQTPPPPPEPLIQLPELNWSDKNTYLKLALLVGSVLLARRAFRQMTDDY